jgi:FkbM family methyltransferase
MSTGSVNLISRCRSAATCLGSFAGSVRRFLAKRYLLLRFKPIYVKRGYSLAVDNNLVVIQGNGLRITGKALNTIWTGKDILCNGSYDFHINGNFIMIDVGLNVGIAALAVARKEAATKIYGYEPFSPTFDQALDNIRQNPELSHKIEIFNVGLGNEDMLLDINYNAKLPGAMSSVRNRFPYSGHIERIEIKKASGIISGIIERHSEHIFLKIDCEGAEYGIIEDLNEADLLRYISIICLEWHFKSPESLIEILKNNGFVVFNHVKAENELGNIRAVNTRSISREV